jgi:cytochrome c-type biogenesis protein CcmH
MPELRTMRTLAPVVRKAKGLLVAVVACAFAAAAVAKEAIPEAADPALEARMVRITSELRCLVCQNQTIADSNAPLAADLRREARELLKQGKSDAEVVDYMTARYGDFVLYRPPLRATTVLLWFGPPLLLGVGGAVLVMVLRRRSRMAPEAFDPDEDDGNETMTAEVAPGAHPVGGA